MKSSIRWSLGLGLCTMMISVCSTFAEEQVFRGELAEGDKTHKQSDGLVDYYVVRAEAGQLMTITMKPAEDANMDTYLYVVGPSGQEYSNDDTEEEGSRLTFRVPETGEWEIAATAYEDETGAYVVTAMTRALKVVLGERGELEEGDEVLLKQGELYDKFTLEVEAGKTYAVMGASSDFDTFLAVHFPGGFANNDDAEGGTGMSLVIFRPTKAGQATIVMTSSYERAEGRYRLAAYETVTAEKKDSP